MQNPTKPNYYVVFYDVSKPKNFVTAMQKRVQEKQWTNLIDGLETKLIQLRAKDTDALRTYKILSHRTFLVEGLIENTFYAVFDCEKVVSNNMYPVEQKMI